jgi:hypothetical protein
MKSSTIAIALSALAATTLAQVGPSTQWDFNGDYGPTVGAQPIVVDAGGTHSFGSEPIGDGTAGVASFAMSSDGRHGFYFVQHGLEANGGGVYVNQYTVVMDVRFFGTTSGQPWIALFNTNDSNNNDADAYIRVDGTDAAGPFGTMGIGGVYGGRIYPERWNRLVIAVNTNQRRMTWYVNGVHQAVTPITGVDGRFALFTVNHITPWFTLFGEGDPSGDYTKPGQINTLQVYGRELNAAEAAALGGPAPLGAGAFVAGQVAFGGFAGADYAGRALALTFERGTAVERKQVALAADGSFLANTALFGPAPTSVFGKGVFTLRRSLGAIAIPISTGASGLHGVLTPGDVDGDGAVNLADFLILASVYDQPHAGDPNLSPNPDLNGDGQVDLADFLLLAASYEMPGD